MNPPYANPEEYFKKSQRSFYAVNLETSLRLAERIPATVIKVSESGIRTAGDVRKLRQAGYDAMLVGEHLMRSRDPAKALRNLLK